MRETTMEWICPDGGVVTIVSEWRPRQVPSRAGGHRSRVVPASSSVAVLSSGTCRRKFIIDDQTRRIIRLSGGFLLFYILRVGRSSSFCRSGPASSVPPAAGAGETFDRLGAGPSRPVPPRPSPGPTGRGRAYPGEPGRSRWRSGGPPDRRVIRPGLGHRTPAAPPQARSGPGGIGPGGLAGRSGSMGFGGQEGDGRDRAVQSSAGSLGGFGSEAVFWVRTSVRTPRFLGPHPFPHPL
jgi:hypothetical protein